MQFSAFLGIPDFNMLELYFWLRPDVQFANCVIETTILVQENLKFQNYITEFEHIKGFPRPSYI